MLKKKQKKKKPFKSYGKSNNELNALIEKKFQKFVRRKTEKELQHFQEIQISDDESKKRISNIADSVESGEISAFSSE